MSQITAKQHVAISALLTERNVTDAAKVVGVARRTLERWTADDETFKQALAAAQAAAFDAMVRSLSSLSSDAINVLADQLKGGSAALKVKVALAILDRLSTFYLARQTESKIGEFEEMINRLSAMESDLRNA